MSFKTPIYRFANNKKIIGMKKWQKLGCGCLSVLLIGVILFVGLIVGAFYERADFETSSERRRGVFDNATKIEKLSGLRLPEFDVIEHKMGIPHVTGDLIDTLVVKYKTANLDSLSKQLMDKKDWHNMSDSLHFQFANPKERYSIDLILSEESNKGEIIFAQW